MAKKPNASYAMVAYIDGWMKAYNPELGYINISFKDDTEEDFKASVRGDIVEFYTIKHKPKKRNNISDNDIVILNGVNSDEHIFVRNITWDNKKKSFDANLAQELKDYNR